MLFTGVAVVTPALLPDPAAANGTICAMPQLLDPPIAEYRARARRETSPHGVGAAVYWDQTEPDRDGINVRCLITDTINGFATITVWVPRAETIDRDRIDAAVERAAGRFSADGDMKAMAAALEHEPLVINIYDPEWRA